jgi:MFS family permease
MNRQGEFSGHDRERSVILCSSMARPHEIASSRSHAPRNDAPETVIASEAKQSRATEAGAAATIKDRLRLVLVGLGISVVPLDTAVNIAFPDITGSFGLPIAMIQWVVICYVLTHAGLMLAFGRVGDMWGHGRVFRAGLAWSVVAFLLCAAAPSFGWLLFFRFLQGIGAGLIISCAPALVTSLYPEARRSHALGIFTLMFAIGSASGPLIGGALVGHWGWPAVFWFRAPIALISLLFVHGLPRAGAATEKQRFDIAGALLLAFGLATLLLAVNTLPRLRDGHYLGVLLLAAAVISLSAFIWWENRAAQPVIRVELFREVGFAIVNLASCLMYLVTFSVMLISPFFLRGAAGLAPFEASLVLASGFAAMALTSPFASAVIGRLAPSRAAALGALATGTGLFLVGSWQQDTAPLAMVLTLALQGLGLGFFQVAYLDLVMAASPLAHRGVAGSIGMLTRTIGTVSGAAVLTLGFQAIAAIAAGGGADEALAFLTAYHAMFRIAGLGAGAVALLVVYAGRAGRYRE